MVRMRRMMRTIHRVTMTAGVAGTNSKARAEAVRRIGCLAQVQNSGWEPQAFRQSVHAPG